MSAQVFISFSSKDREIAQDIWAALEGSGIRCWCSDKNLFPGEAWASKIPAAIRSSAVMLLVWSHHAAKSGHVEREIGLAGDADLSALPVRLDETPYEGTSEYYLTKFNWTIFPAAGAKGLVEPVRRILRLLDGVYPLAHLYHETSAGELDFDRHLAAIRFLTRYIALLHAALYANAKHRDPQINRAIENLLASPSLFMDLKITRQIVEFLAERGIIIHDGIRDFFKLALHDFPNTAPIEGGAGDDAAFDREHLYELCGARNDLAYGRRIPQEQALRDLCSATRQFLRDALSLGWVDVCQMFVSGPKGALPIRGPLDRAALPETLATRPSLWIEIASGQLELTPFFSLLAAADGKHWEVGLQVKGQGDRTSFAALSVDKPLIEERPSIPLPWGQIQITRTLPPRVYVGETHEVRLELTSRSHAEITIPRLDEVLPDNVIGPQGQSRLTVASDLVLAPGQRLTLSYPIQGTPGAILGSTRVFATDHAVHFRFLGEEGRVTVGGDRNVWVQTLPPPRLCIKRTLRNCDGNEIISSTVALDTEVIVKTELTCEGQRLDDVRVSEVIDGGEVIEGESVLHTGTIQRLDLQPPITKSYMLRVRGRGELVIHTEATAAQGAVPVEGEDTRCAIRELPDPRLQLRWLSVTRKDAHHLQARLCVENCGGTSAYNLSISVDPQGASIQTRYVTPTVPRLLTGSSTTVEVELECVGVPSGMIRFSATFRSVQDHPGSETIDLCLDRVIAGDFLTLPAMGRDAARSALQKQFTGADTGIINLYGERGVGKRYLLLSVLEDLVRVNGLRVAHYEIDCSDANSLGAGLTTLIEQVVFNEAPPSEHGSRAALLRFLNSIGIDEAEYSYPTGAIERLVDRAEEPHTGSWKAVSLVLRKLAISRQYQPLVVILTEVSVGRAELEVVLTLRNLLTGYANVRFVITTQEPLKNLGVDSTEIEVGRFTADECRNLIERVFVMPPAAETLQRALIERSECLPSNLLSLLKHLITNPDRLLDFRSPTGVRLADPEAFDALPTSVLEDEQHNAELSGIPRPVLACLAAIPGPILPERIASVLGDLGKSSSVEEVEASLEECRKLHWFKSTGDDCVLTSATVRKAIENTVPPDMLVRTHEVLFEAFEKERCDREITFTHLAASSIHFVESHAEQFLDGLRDQVRKGHFSYVRSLLDRLKAAGLNLTPEHAVRLAALELELQWEETGDLNTAVFDALMERSVSVRPRRERSILKARLGLVGSRWYARRQHDLERAVGLAEAAEWRLGPCHHLPVADPQLRFDHYLNLWEISYRGRDEKRFLRADRWIWTYLERQQKLGSDGYAIARFLALFLDLQREFPGKKERERYFFPTPVPTDDRGQRLRENPIEVATRTNRIRESFLDKFLSSPDALNQKNVAVLGRLYFDLGAALWKGRWLVHGQTAEALSYLDRAEQLFADAGFPIDLANTRRALAQTYIDRIAAAERADRTDQVHDLSHNATRWLRLATEGFDAVNAATERVEARNALADVLYRLALQDVAKIKEAIAAYEDLRATAWQCNGQELDVALIVRLADLYERDGRLEEAIKLLGEPEIENQGLKIHKALIRAEMLRRGQAPITAISAPDIEACFEMVAQHLRQSGADDLNNLRAQQGLPAPREAIGIFAWHLAEFHRIAENALRALYFLRNGQRELASCKELSGILGERLPQVLPQLWMMTAAPDDLMVEDFANLVAPFANEQKAAIAELLEQVWKWEESAMRRKAHLAAAGMSLLLCEASLVRPYAPDAQEALANQVLAALTQLDSRELHKATSLIGRGLTVLLRLGAERRDDRKFQQKLAAVLRRCEEEQLPQTALWVLVHVIQSLLDLHMQTQQEWYYEVVRSVSDYMQVSQEVAAVDLDLFAPLINLYLQLPNRLPAAIDLMERQCDQLAATGDYKLLARYLSFLSDLLGRIEAENVSSASLLKILDRESAGNASAEDATGEAESETLAPEGRNMKQLREVATDLCARIIADLQLRPLTHSTEQILLYNAAKLLPAERAPDLVTAIYAKLYDLADGVDGSCVWGAYQAWSIGAAKLNERFLEDSIALTTYSNCTDEGSDGRFKRNPRNYLITARARNDLVHLLAARSTDAHLSTVHSQLELLRLICLRKRVEDLQGYLHDLDQFKQVEFVTFLHGYLFSDRDGGPLWRRIKDIERHGENLESEIKKVIERMAMQGFPLEGSSDSIFEAISFAVDDFLIDYRRRGRDLMQRFALAVRDFELGRILQEVQMFLRTGERSLIFDTLVQRDREQFPSQSSALQQLRDEYYESLLKKDSERVVPLLLAHALQLQRDGDAASAERFYRHLLRRVETSADASVRLPAILSGLARSLRAQDRDEEARPFLIQEITLRSGSDDPELPSARVQLAEILSEAAETDEAEAVYRSALADCERILGAEHPETARTYNQLGVLLHRLGRLQEAEPLHRQALATCERVLGPEHPETLRSLINLAILLHRKGDYGRAELLYHRALEACERIFGPEHPSTLASVDNLATLLANKGDYDGAEPWLRRALEARERVLGPEHSDTLTSAGNLADLMENTGHREEARSLRTRRLAILESKSGATSLELRTAALDAYQLADYSRATRLLLRVLDAGFEIPSTYLHLARIALITGDDAGARHHVVEAWERRGEAQPYVVPRILWAQLALRYASPNDQDSKQNVQVILGRLKTALACEGAHVEWAMDPVLAHLQSRLPPKQHVLLAALVGALSDAANLPALDQFSAWRQATSQPIE